MKQWSEMTIFNKKIGKLVQSPLEKIVLRLNQIISKLVTFSK